jgi:cytochrome c nitrite reductase small subunit
MNNKKLLKTIAIFCGISATCLAVYTAYVSKAHSYLSEDPRACINCHVMNTQYATWQHSSHKEVGCIECHLPTDNTTDKLISKMKDGWNHSLAFTLNTYDHAIKISEDGARRVQQNCVSCHSDIVSNIQNNKDLNHNFKELKNVVSDTKCWDCHKSVPHGKVRSLTTVPYNLGVKEVK